MAQNQKLSEIGAAGDIAMASGLHTLQVRAFRNYQAAELDLEGKAVVLTGPNGAGKTNLLEAVSMLAPGGVAACPTRRNRLSA